MASMKEQYPDLTGLLASYYGSCQGPVPRTDEQVVGEYCSGAAADDIRTTLDQLRAVLSLPSTPYHQIEELTGFGFDSEESCREWLDEIAGLLLRAMA